MHVLVTGATGKVGRTFLSHMLGDPRWAGVTIRALCHNRGLPAQPRLETVHGSISDPDLVKRALAGITHVFHMATVKEDAALAMDVSVKGMFLLLEEFRQSPTARQFVLIGGDCTVGHCFVPYDEPVTELSPRRAYPGVYALSKVLEEVMLEQYQIQYGLNGTVLRAPWIMEKDDFRYVLSFGDDQFGGPAWDTLISPAEQRLYAANDNVPILLDHQGAPLKRNFVHVDDLVRAMAQVIDLPAARQQLFNISMTRPLDYAEMALHLQATRGLRGVSIKTSFYSNALDNAKARHMLAWEPEYDLSKLIDSAFAYQRAATDVRKVWYAG